jgi:hypothetical protein
MKKVIVFLASSIIGFTGFAQFPNNSTDSKELWYEVRGLSGRRITKEKLSQSRLIRDIIEGYPDKWIGSYNSVEIITTLDGKVRKAFGVNEVLNKEQLSILKQVDLSSNVVILVNYKYSDPVSKKIEKRRIDVTLNVVPERAAEYVGGEKQLMQYLNKKVKEKSLESSLKGHQQRIQFTINEEGKIMDVKSAHSKTDEKTSGLLMEIITNMPQWTPAEDIKGNKVKQVFEFTVGSSGC